MRPVLLFVIAGALLLLSAVAVPAEKSVRSRAQPASSYKFEDLTITRQVEADGKPISGFVSYFRLNRALPFAPRGKFEGEEECGPRLFAAYLSVDHVHEEGLTETMGDDARRHCYTETIEVNAHESASHFRTCECVARDPRASGDQHPHTGTNPQNGKERTKAQRGTSQSGGPALRKGLRLLKDVVLATQSYE
jgi:hypothetical protein